jgi:putative transport protein
MCGESATNWFRNRFASDTDIIALSAGIVLGGLIGILSMNVLGISISLSVVGVHYLGLIFGWLHSRVPVLRPHSRTCTMDL